MLRRDGMIAAWNVHAERPEPWRADEHEERRSGLVALLDVP
jgi:hypothetical protein